MENLVQYSDLKKDKKNGFPTYDSLEPLLLVKAAEKDNWQGKDLRNWVVNEVCHLDANLVNHRDKLYERSGFALSYLHSVYGLLDKPFRKIYRINSLGNRILAQAHSYVDLFEAINKLPKRSKTSSRRIDDNVQGPDDHVSNQRDFYDQVSDQFDEYNDNVKDHLLNKVIAKEPSFFEQLVVQLLAKMGYKGINGDAIVTQLSNDNGIDGIINQDPLGTSTVYIQAKRYSKDHKITAPQIQGFRGALESKRATKGVFITTSDYSEGALMEAERLSIVTINGDQLTDLMLEYQVGVQVKADFKILTIDTDFFESN